MNKYKSGQLVTINNHVYRILKRKNPSVYTCSICDLQNLPHNSKTVRFCGLGRLCLSMDQYLKRVR